MPFIPLSLAILSGSQPGWIVLGLLLTSVVLAATLLRLRRVSSGPGLKRPLAGLTILFVSLPLAYGGLLARHRFQADPEFDDPRAYLNLANCDVSPDGKTVYLSLQHPGPLSYRDSLWAIDTETLDRERLPDPAKVLHPLLASNPQCIAAVASWDGREILGALSVNEHTQMFALDLDTKETHSIPWPTFTASVNYGGWTFRRSVDEAASGGETYRASHAGDPRIQPFDLPTNAEPVVAGADRLQIFYTGMDGSVQHYDALRKSSVALGLENPGGERFRVSPDARWILLPGGDQRPTLYEVSTGRRRVLPKTKLTVPASGDFPVIESGTVDSGNVRGQNWTLMNLDRDVHITTEVPVDSLRPINSSTLLGLDAWTESAYLIELDGRLKETLRAPADR